MKKILDAIQHLIKPWVLAPLAALSLVACGGGSSTACAEKGPYACKTGDSEPLYVFQWALNYAQSYFNTHADPDAFGGGLDLNIEPVHRMGYKGQGVKILVIDEGTDLRHEDLIDNADFNMSWNYATNSNDPMPPLIPDDGAHGTNVAGIIAAAQNGKGVMGIAPQVKLGAVPFLSDNGDHPENMVHAESLGGAAWSQGAHIINASYGLGILAKRYSIDDDISLAAIRSLKSLRDGKGIIYIKSAGNHFDDGKSRDYYIDCGDNAYLYDCVNSSNDTSHLEPSSVVVAALNAKGQAASYSSSGSVVWITGMAGEYGSFGNYGETSFFNRPDGTSTRHNGPTIFSTDVRGCAHGYAHQDAGTSFLRGQSSLNGKDKDNSRCDYAYMNGTSAAAPTISGITALMLSANPNLTWKDVRDILKSSARQIDPGYEARFRQDIRGSLPLPYNAHFDLRQNKFMTSSGSKDDITVNAHLVPFEFGWQKNAAGNVYSNWYGFGVPDAHKAVQMALEYKDNPSLSKPSPQHIPPFKSLEAINKFEYQKVSLLSTFKAEDQIVDAFQVRLSSEDVCIGSFGIVVESPSGTKSYLKLPLDHFASIIRTIENGRVAQEDTMANDDMDQFGLSSYAFYGENAKGIWKIYSVASNPSFMPIAARNNPKLCNKAPSSGHVAEGIEMLVEARVIPQ